MAGNAGTDDNDAFDSPHLPERYRQVVRAKKQRRQKKQILIAGVAVLVITGIFLIASWVTGGISFGIPSSSPLQQHPVTETVPPESPAVSPALSNGSSNTTLTFDREPGLVAPRPPGIISLENAVTALQEEYPAADYLILSANLTRGAGRSLYEFRIQQKDTNGGAGTASRVFIDGMSGNIFTPGEEEVKISRDAARQQALAAFPSLHPDRVLMVFSGSQERGRTWEFSLLKEGETEVSGVMDAETGTMNSFTRRIAAEGRPATPAVDVVRARAIADRYIIDHNGGQLPLNMSLSRYEPLASPSGTVAGQYVFTYERTFQDYPTDTDGFTVMVDAVTDEVVGYTHQWTTPEYAFFAAPQPNVIRREATFAVLQKAKELYPDNVGGLRIISAEIRWMNNVPYGTVPRPGTIPLGWKVVFDDDIIRANASLQPAVAWIDVQSGNFIAFDYRH